MDCWEDCNFLRPLVYLFCFRRITHCLPPCISFLFHLLNPWITDTFFFRPHPFFSLNTHTLSFLFALDIEFHASEIPWLFATLAIYIQGGVCSALCDRVAQARSLQSFLPRIRAHVEEANLKEIMMLMINIKQLPTNNICLDPTSNLRQHSQTASPLHLVLP